MRLIKLLSVFLFVFSLVSCTITEKMIINDKGSGKFTYEIDGSKMMSMVGSAFKGDSDKDAKNGKDKKNEKNIDSTFTFKEMFANKKDSIAKLSAEEQEKIKKMERFSVHMIMNEEKGIMNYSMFTDFASVQELQDVMNPVQSMKSLVPAGKDKTAGADAAIPEDNSSTKFFFDGNTFKKTVSKLKKKKETFEETKSEDELAANMKQSMEMLYTESSFKVVYEFPKAVKKVSAENVTYSKDRKTITIEYPLKEYMENPEKLNFEVEFEK
ncbi:hypothetical protein OX283_008900 [Flavobacterium sp. SUN052]|uniref:hypothetical protein n=1 Tax=Flavobacterium sp. SUN052 TaxID=3002441 RepID=UPI00237DC277|nr:hypothetical protein [Flavobacterium sp. SUN052]MEC4004774.1 hypothetical protein [Flavobacterium sp. SUN052]